LKESVFLKASYLKIDRYKRKVYEKRDILMSGGKTVEINSVTFGRYLGIH